MKIKVVDSDKFSPTTAMLVGDKIRLLQETPGQVVNIVFATGNTMVGFLDNLAKENIDWNRVRAFHLDEYKGLSTNSPCSFAYFLTKNIFSKVKIPLENINFINGANPDLAGYMSRLKSFGGADIVLLGIGIDGHLAFNEPPVYSKFTSRMQEVKLTESTIEANKADYPDIEKIPYAYTMGMADIFEGKHIFLFANKLKKADIVQKAIFGKISENVPASLIQNHSQVTVVLDIEAASRLPVFAEKRL